MLAGCAVALAACGSPDAAAREDEVPRWTLAEELRYRPDERAPLTAVEALVPGPDGRVFAVDRGTSSVLAFGPDGGFERAIGREGDGPGEFRRLWRVGVVGDTVWAIDSRVDRLSLFSSDGSFLGSTDILRETELPDSLRSVTPLARMGDGSVLVVAAPPASVQTPGGPRSADRLFLFRARPGAEAVPVDTVDVRHWSWEVRFRDGALFTRQPLADAEILEPSPYGEGWAIVGQPQPASARVGTYDVERFGPSGASGFRREVEYPPTRVGEEEVQQALAAQEEILDRLVQRGLFASRAAAREAFEGTLYRPEYLPPVTSRGTAVTTESVRIDDQGRVWVERRPETVPGGIGPRGSRADDGDPSMWDVVGPQGRIAQAVAPPGARLLAVRGEHAWGVVTDELDVPTIVRWRIVHP